MMKESYKIYVFTRDRDLNDEHPYKDIAFDKWVGFDESVTVYYSSPAQLSWKNIQKQIRNINPDFIYLNSMFSRYFTIYPLLLARNAGSGTRIILAPRGMLRSSALRFRSTRKKIFLTGFRICQLYKKVRFHATDETELSDIRYHFSNKAAVRLVADCYPALPGKVQKISKTPGELSMIFVGRLHPVKNLDYLLKILPGVNGRVSLTIVGSEEDKAYTDYCRKLCIAYPKNLSVFFSGEIAHDQLPGMLAKHHIFAMPTKGENFGHAIFEALAAARPVLISDQTPWRFLEDNKAGWDISLEHSGQFRHALQQAVEFDQEQYDRWAASARKYVQDFVERIDLKNEYYNLFS